MSYEENKNKCREFPENIFANFKQKFAEIKCQNITGISGSAPLKGKMKKVRKICLKIHLSEQKPCNLLP